MPVTVFALGGRGLFDLFRLGVFPDDVEPEREELFADCLLLGAVTGLISKCPYKLVIIIYIT